MGSFINYNGKLFNAGEPVLTASNRSYRYGDGVFETMKYAEGKIVLADLHFERLTGALKVLNIPVPKLITPGFLENEMHALCLKNGCNKKARIRLSVSRGNGGLYDGDNKFQYLIECWPLNPGIEKLNENGLVIDIFPDGRKAIDKFSNLKSASYLPYTMAALWASENQLNDCLLLNTSGRICDATIANVFWIKNEIIYTPPLSEGCVAGVMRRYLIEKLPAMGYNIQEQELEIANMEQADEVFLSNAISGIRWVRQYGSKTYKNQVTIKIFNELFQTNRL